MRLHWTYRLIELKNGMIVRSFHPIQERGMTIFVQFCHVHYSIFKKLSSYRSCDFLVRLILRYIMTFIAIEYGIIFCLFLFFSYWWYWKLLIFLSWYCIWLHSKILWILIFVDCVIFSLTIYYLQIMAILSLPF